jgi:hypothetical protein
MVIAPGKARMMSPRASTRVLAPEAEVPAPPASPRNILYKVYFRAYNIYMRVPVLSGTALLICDDH